MFHKKTLNALEKFFIKKCCSLYSLKLGGCNIDEGGNNTCPSRSEIAREKIRLSHLGDKNPIHKHIFTQEEKDLMRNRRLGVKMSDEQKKKISIALSGRKIDESKILRGEKHWAYGKHFSEETRKKMSKSQSGRKVSSETKEKMRISALKRYEKL